MRKLIVEFPKDELSKVEGDSPLLQNVKTLEVLMFLKHCNEEITLICRVELETEVSNIKEYAKLVGDNIYEAQLLERETEGAYILLVKHKLKHVDENLRTRSQVLWEKGGYIVSREMWEGKFRITFLGSVYQIKETLKTLECSGIRHRIISSTNATFSPNSSLSVLTEKQRRILITSYKLGYFDLPRKINSRQLAEKLGIHKSALVAHIRKAEQRLLADILS